MSESAIAAEAAKHAYASGKVSPSEEIKETNT